MTSDMDLMDYFAGQAMVALLAPEHLTLRDPAEQLAKLSYQIAEAMVIEKGRRLASQEKVEGGCVHTFKYRHHAHDGGVEATCTKCGVYSVRYGG